MKFIESIRLENGKLFHLEIHQRRLDLTLLAHYGISVRIDLASALSAEKLPQVGLHKIRITYSEKIERIETELYVRRRVTNFALAHAKDLDYRFKYADRSSLDNLKAGLASGGEPIIVMNGYVTDATYANLCFFDGTRWLTPEKPILKGVALTAAWVEAKIVPVKILAEHLQSGKYNRVKLINCMTLFDEAEIYDLNLMI